MKRIITIFKETRREVSEDDSQKPIGNKTRGIKYDLRTQKFRNPYVSLAKRSKSKLD